MLYAVQRRTQPQRTWCQRGYSSYAVTVPSRHRPTYPHPSFVSQGPTREKDEQARKKTETHTRAKTGRKCMPGRRVSRRRVEERVKGHKATEKTGDSQQPSKGRAQGRGHGKHTASTTPQRSTGEGGTRGTGGRQHHAPLHAPHRHHTHRTHPHPHPQHVASRPQQPAGRADSREGGVPEPRRPPLSPWCAAPHRAREPRGQCRAPTPAHPRPQQVGGGPRHHRPEGGWSGEEERLTSDAPHNGERYPPPGTPFCHPHSAQRQPARAHAVGPVLGPHARTDRT